MEICKAIKKEKKSLSSTVLKRQQSKYQRDNITIFDHPRKKRRFRKSKRRHHNNQRKLLYREKERKIIEEAKTTCPDQNAINLSNKDLSHAEQSLLRKGSSFIPTPTDINWYNLRRNFDSLSINLDIEFQNQRNKFYKCKSYVKYIEFISSSTRESTN